MKKIFTILAAAVTAFAGYAADEAEMVTCLAVNLHNGNTEYYTFAETPEVKVENHQIVVSSVSLNGTYNFEDVSHFSFERRDASGVGEIIASDNASFSITFVDNRNVIVYSPQLEWVKVFTLGGVEVAAAKADNGTATVDLDTAAPGVYIVAPSCHSAIKIYKR